MVKFTDSKFDCFVFHILRRRCSGCKKRRSLRTNSFFGEFPKVSLGTLLRVIFSFTQEDSQKRIAENVNLNMNLVSQICRRLQDFCAVDLQYRPVIPFGGAGAVVKCDESKFNHKAKVTCLHVKHVLRGVTFKFSNRC